MNNYFVLFNRANGQPGILHGPFTYGEAEKSLLDLIAKKGVNTEGLNAASMDGYCELPSGEAVYIIQPE